MNLDDLLNPAALQRMKGIIDNMQEKLHDIKVTGESGAGMVKVTLNGVFECIHIDIDPEALKDVTTLRILLKSAHHAAWEKIRAMVPSQDLNVNDIDTLFKK